MMSWDLVLRHSAAIRATLDATRVSLELLSAQLAGLDAYAMAQHQRETVPTARIELPDHCAGIDGTQCALQHEESRIDKGSLTHPHAWICTGCRVYSENGLTT